MQWSQVSKLGNSKGLEEHIFMKTIFRSLSLGFLLAAIIAGGALSGFAQDPPADCADVDGFNALYTKFTGTISVDAKTNKSVFNPKTVAEKQAALDNAKQILEKYGACPTFAENVNYVKGWISPIETAIKAQTERETVGVVVTRYDNGIRDAKYDDAYAAGKEILAKQPENLNVLVPLGLVGLYESYKNNFKYNDDSIRYAQQALSLIKSGKELPKRDPKTGVQTAGVFAFERTKEAAISELTYAIGYITYYGKKDKKAALPYYYEVTQLPGPFKTEPRVYQSIGNYYVDEAAKVGQEIAALIAKQKAAKTEAEKEQIDKEIEPKTALFNGYTERIIDAYARAYTVAKADTPANKTYKEGLYKTLQDTYRRRFDKIEGLDAYVASTVAKPLPNPTTAVTPVLDPAPAATTPVSAAPITAPPVPAPTAKLAPAAATKPAATTSKPPVKTAVVPKRRGTR